MISLIILFMKQKLHDLLKPHIYVHTFNSQLFQPKRVPEIGFRYHNLVFYQIIVNQKYVIFHKISYKICIDTNNKYDDDH